MKTIILFSLLFVLASCKTETDIKYERLQEYVDSARYDHSLPSINTGINTDTLCPN